MNASLRFDPLPSPVAELGLSARGRLYALVAAVGVGFAVTVHPLPILGAVMLPILLAFVVHRPEWILILFLTAGIYKQDPRITSVLPMDVTVVTGSMLVLALAVDAVRRPLRIPAPIWLLAPLVIMLGQGIVGRASEYGQEKAMRFCTLTLLGILGSCVLISDRERLNRFLVAVAVIGFLLSVDATHQPETTSEGRLTAHGSNPIILARVGALALAFGWIRFHFARRPFDKLLYVVILAVTSVCVLGAGSRGPVLSIVLGMGLLSFVTAAYHGRSPIGITTMLLVGGLAMLAISFAAIPSLPLYRFQLLFSEDKGTSIIVRGILMATACKLILAHPLGLGVGGFERYAILDLKYPHNMFLEVGSELGWIPLLCLVVLFGLSFKALLDILRKEYSWSTLFLSIALLASWMNSMLTGDLNANRLLFALLLLPFTYRRDLEAPAPARNAWRPSLPSPKPAGIRC